MNLWLCASAVCAPTPISSVQSDPSVPQPLGGNEKGCKRDWNTPSVGNQAWLQSVELFEQTDTTRGPRRLQLNGPLAHEAGTPIPPTQMNSITRSREVTIDPSPFVSVKLLGWPEPITCAGRSHTRQQPSSPVRTGSSVQERSGGGKYCSRPASSTHRAHRDVQKCRKIDQRRPRQAYSFRQLERLETEFVVRLPVFKHVYPSNLHSIFNGCRHVSEDGTRFSQKGLQNRLSV